MKISELQKKDRVLYDTDKFGSKSSWTRLHVAHNYMEFYDNFFLNVKDKKLKLLEIGVKFGGSVRLFHDYLINSNIIGVNINNEWKNGNIKDYPRLNLFTFNGYDLNQWEKLPYKKFDIIIDDGPHTLDTQIFAFNNFPNYLDEKGILIIEDVNKNNIDKIINLKNKYKYNIEIYNWSDQTKRIDDVIITIKNK